MYDANTNLNADNDLTQEQDERTRLEMLVHNGSLRIVFQPIVNLANGEVTGYEALTRPHPDSGFAHPGELFGAAERLGMVWEVEAIARRKAYERAAKFTHGRLIFMNNSPEVFYAPEFADWMRNIVRDLPNLNPSSIVLEVTERQQATEGMDKASTERIAELRDMGFQIAIDDVGAGTNGLNRIMAMRPDWLKLDLELVTHIDSDAFKHNMLRFFVSFARISGIKLVAEGIERDAELTTLIDLGVSHGQGFYLGHPIDNPEEIDGTIAERICEIARLANARRFNDPRAVELGTLATATPAFEQNKRLGDIYDRLELLGSTDGVIVLDGKRFLGWVSQPDIDAAIANGHYDIPLGQLPRVSENVVNHDMRLQDVFGLVAAREGDAILAPLVVRHADHSYRTLSLRQLLITAGTTDWMATRVSPLTGLPNRVVVDHWLTECIRSRDPAHVVFFDLVAFNQYNQAFGFDMGDAMIRQLVGLVRAELNGSDESEFLGHLGSDRFIFTTRSDPMPQMVSLIEAFDNARGDFFSADVLERGKYSVKDVNGTEETMPLTALRVMVLKSPFITATSSNEIHALASEISNQPIDHSRPPIERILTDNRTDVHTRRAAG